MEFVDIIGFEGLYKINSNGDILNVKRNKVLKWSVDSGGYYHVSLSKNNKKKGISIHRLIGIHFIPNPNDLPCIDHINRIKTDNRIENLRWISVRDNNINTVNTINRCGSIRTIPRTKKDGTISLYHQLRYNLPNEYGNKNRKSKNFKSMEEAEAFKQSIYG